MGNNQPCSNRDNHSNHSHNRRRHSSRNAGKLQRWYRTNKKRCIRNILDGDDNLECEIPAVELQQYFSQPAPIPSTSPGSEGPPSTNSTDPNDLTQPIVVQEIKSQLKRLPTQSSPGPDGVPYYIWKYTEDSAVSLSMIYNICLHNEDSKQLEIKQYYLNL